MGVDKIGVHKTHCCVLHGCKYGDQNCPVESKLIAQEYPCEMCWNIGVRNIQDLIELMNNQKKTCPHCGHVLE